MKDRRSGPRRGARVAMGLLALSLPVASGVAAQVAYGPADPPAARVWLDQGDDPVLQLGDRVRVYYRTSADAYVAIFHIDTNGTTTLVFPRSPDEDHYVRGGRDYRLLFPRSPYWYVEDHPGVGYYFIVASPERFDLSRFRFSHYDQGWDLSLVGRQVYRDPYVAMDEYVAALIPDWDVVPYALDFSSYSVGERYEYPRFLCYDCHGFRPYGTWNPYYSVCTSFRVVIYDDPYFYPSRRYRGDRVVWARPPVDRPRFTFKERVAGESAAPVVRVRSAPEVAAPATRRSPENGAGGVRPQGTSTPRRSPVDLGTFRGGGATRPETSPARPGRAGGRPEAVPVVPDQDGGRRAPLRPTDEVRGGVVAPTPAAPSAAADVDERTGTGTMDRVRPVLRKRPSQEPTPTPTRTPDAGDAGRGGGTVSPAPPPSRTRPRLPSRGGSASERPTARPRSGGERAAPTRPSGGAVAPPPSSPPSRRPPRSAAPSGAERERPAPRSRGEAGSRGAGSSPPRVRSGGDGRPVLRRPDGR